MARKRYTRRRSKGRFAFLYKLLAFVVTCTAIALALTLEQLLSLLQALDERSLAGDVQSIDLSDPSQITLRYLDRFDVCFPRDTDYGYKLDYLLAVVEKLEINETGTINMMQEGKARFIPE